MLNRRSVLAGVAAAAVAPAVMADSHPDAELIRLAREYSQKVSEALAYTDDDNFCREVGKANACLIKMWDIPAQTFDGLKAKLGWLVEEDLLFTDEDTLEGSAMRSVARDLGLQESERRATEDQIDVWTFGGRFVGAFDPEDLSVKAVERKLQGSI